MKLRFDEDKFINAVLFFATQSDASSFGVTKLNKLLFFSDFEHFKQYGRPIIGDRYVNMEKGPVPSTAYNIINELLSGIEGVSLDKKNAKKIEVKEETYVYKGKGKRKPVSIHRIKALAKPDLSVFSKSELAVMSSVLEACNKNKLSATSLSKLTHIPGSPWSKTKRNQTIEYSLALDGSRTSVSKDYVNFWDKEASELAEIVDSPPYAAAG